MRLSPAARLMLQNQAAIMDGLRQLLSEQWSGPHGGKGTEAAMAAVDRQNRATVVAIHESDTADAAVTSVSVGAFHETAIIKRDIPPPPAPTTTPGTGPGGASFHPCTCGLLTTGQCTC